MQCWLLAPATSCTDPGQADCLACLTTYHASTRCCCACCIACRSCTAAGCTLHSAGYRLWQNFINTAARAPPATPAFVQVHARMTCQVCTCQKELCKILHPSLELVCVLSVDDCNHVRLNSLIATCSLDTRCWQQAGWHRLM